MVSLGCQLVAGWPAITIPLIRALLIDNAGVAQAMGDTTRDCLVKLWALVDEILNAVLFLRIGRAVIVFTREPRLPLLGLAVTIQVGSIGGLTNRLNARHLKPTLHQRT